MRRLALLGILAAASPALADKSPTVASALSGTGAGVSGALVLASFVIGTGNNDVNTPLFITGLVTSVVTPSLGQIYSGEYVTYGMAVRGAAGVLAAFAIISERQTVTCDNGVDRDCKQIKGAGIALLGLAAIGYIGAMAWDVMDAPEAAARANDSAVFKVSLAPTVIPHGGGLALVGSF